MSRLLLLGLLLFPACSGGATGGDLPSADYGPAFWDHWGDGRAELAGYALRYPRYGALRDGVAVTIFVTEDFSKSARVKNEDPARAAADVVPVLKLNLIQDFATGVYDYNLMTSTFVALDALDARPAGFPAKIAFSSQEWCGQVYSELLFEPNAVAHRSHSYFDGEADRQQDLDYPANGLAEDALLLWARGLAAPRLEPGERRRVRLLRSVETARLEHLPVEWLDAEIVREERPTSIEVPAGRFVVDVLRIDVAPGVSRRTYPPTHPSLERPARSWTFYVERDAPGRLVRWERSDGLEADLLGSERLAYWALNGPGFEGKLAELGLRPRPPRTP